MHADPIAFPFAWPSPLEPPKELLTLRDRPVVPAVLPDGSTAWLVTRYEDIRTVLSDPRLSRNRNRPDGERMVKERKKAIGFVDMDPPEHTRMRRILARAFTAGRVERMRPLIREAARDLLAAMTSGSPPADLLASFAAPFSVRVLGDLLGVPRDEQDALCSASAREMWLRMQGLVAARREKPANDLISALIEVGDSEDGRLSEHELLHWCVAILMAGNETTATELGGLVVTLLGHPDQLALLRDDLSLMRGAVDELLRCQVVGCSLSMLRYVKEDIEVAGVTVPKGASLICVLESGNYDETVFPEPFRLDITRGGNHHLAFSVGPHYCLGAALARVQLEIALEELLVTLPDLRLAVPVGELRRHDDSFMQGFVQVPVAW
ncbi:cytochrome P450 [Actinoallomurus sp. CA-142502]|uniref:cytochrome P450 n=1 Tax=Actinoallomurus sp. CA-142502 TaxID=3239885 RepID=UPI003D8F811A